jgi:hypothetical protein
MSASMSTNPLRRRAKNVAFLVWVLLATGKVLGRPRVEVDVKKLRASQDGGMSLRKIAAKTKLSLSTVVRSLA